MSQSVHGNGENGSVGRHLQVVDNAERAELADVQDCSGGKLGVPFGRSDDAVGLFVQRLVSNCK